MREIDFTVKTLLKPILKGYSPMLLVIRRNWSNIFGEKYYEFCEPEKVYFQKDKKNEGVLYIKAFNNIISFYIENNKIFILEKINSIFGYNLIKDIKIKQDPRIIKSYKKINKTLDVEATKSIEIKVQNVEDNNLKHCLEELGNSIFLNK